MVTMEINGKDVQCKTSWEELTLNDFQNIYKHWGKELDKPFLDRDYFHLFTIINDLHAAGFIHTPENEEAITTLISWAMVDPGYSKDVPKTFGILGHVFQVPERFKALTIGQNIMLRQVLDKATYKEEVLADAIAITAQPLVDGKFDSKRAQEFRLAVLAMPASEVYGLGFFSLAHVMRVGHGPLNSWSPLKDSLMRSCGRMLQLLRGPRNLHGSPISDSSPVTANDLAKTLTKYSIGSPLELSLTLQRSKRRTANTGTAIATSGNP